MAVAEASVRVTGVAVYPGRPGSVHLTKLSLPRPSPGEATIRVRRVGVCGTDREIIEAKFGSPPAGATELVIGHEAIGDIVEVGEGVESVKRGDIVVATVRRPDGCPACRGGQPDMCLWLGYTERGIIGAHGYMVEAFVERAEHLVLVPASLEPLGVLLEPLSVVEKALRQARLIQRRIADWTPATAVIFGAGPIGLLGTLLLRARGVEVYTVARTRAPNAAASLVEAAGGHYVSTREQSVAELAAAIPNVDLIFECSGNSEPVFAGMSLLGGNGVLVLLSLTGGTRELSVPADRINRDFVLGNKLMVGSVNSAHEDFVAGVEDLARFEQLWPGLTGRHITARLGSLEEAALALEAGIGGIKTVVELAR